MKDFNDFRSALLKHDNLEALSQAHSLLKALGIRSSFFEEMINLKSRYPFFSVNSPQTRFNIKDPLTLEIADNYKEKNKEEIRKMKNDILELQTEAENYQTKESVFPASFFKEWKEKLYRGFEILLYRYDFENERFKST